MKTWQAPDGHWKAWRDDSWLYTWGETYSEAVNKYNQRRGRRVFGGQHGEA